jgi:hypothetical protein
MMGREDSFRVSIEFLYETVLDASLWPQALIRLADTIGVVHIGFAAFDHRASRFDALAPRIDPAMVESYKAYWGFHDPLWPRLALEPAGKFFPRESVISHDDHAATEVYNEWFRPAKVGLSLIGAKLPADNQISAAVFAANPAENDEINSEQEAAFEAALPHFDRAVRIHRMLRIQDLDHDITPGKLEEIGFGVMLVDASAKVLFANAWSRALLAAGSGLTLKGGYLFSTDRAATLHRLIASCAGRLPLLNDFGGEIVLFPAKRSLLRITVTPLRARGTVAELPWLGLRLPVAMVTIVETHIRKAAH